VKRILVCLGALIATYAIAASLKQPDQKCPCTPASQQAPEPDKRGTEASPLSVKLLNTGETERETAEKSKGIQHTEEAENWTIRLTLALVLATVLQFGALLWQGWQLRRQIALGQAEFIATHRPRLVLKRIEVTNVVGTTLGIQCSIANVGDGDGNIIDSRYNLDVSSGRRFPAPVGQSNFGVHALRPGAEVRVSINATLDDGAGAVFAYLERFPEAERGLYFRGFILYADANDVARRTYFSRRYDSRAQRFLPTDDRDYDYAD
jgi:hypothetical protein